MNKGTNLRLRLTKYKSLNSHPGFIVCANWAGKIITYKSLLEFKAELMSLTLALIMITGISQCVSFFSHLKDLSLFLWILMCTAINQDTPKQWQQRYKTCKIVSSFNFCSCCCTNTYLISVQKVQSDYICIILRNFNLKTSCWGAINIKANLWQLWYILWWFWNRVLL